ncbi:MAG: phosphatase PAP2 family protein [Lachnospiraceae bacterium]|nr:phosphatase PAP2 family protein [Lachnospiraceae bacterium]
MEAAFLLWFQDVRTPAGNVIMNLITLLGAGGIVAILCCLVMIFIRKYRVVGIAAGISLAIEALCTNVIIKPLVDRARPYDVIEGLVPATWWLPNDPSFPSGHAGACFAVAVVMLIMLPKKAGITAVVIAFLVSLSRMYLGVHYPTDILAGAALGIITAFIGYFTAVRLIQPKLKNN